MQLIILVSYACPTLRCAVVWMVFACSQTLRKIASTFLEVIKNSSSNCHATATLFLEAVFRTADLRWYNDVRNSYAIRKIACCRASDFHFVVLLEIWLSIPIYQLFGNPSTFDPSQELSFIHTTEHKGRKRIIEK